MSTDLSTLEMLKIAFAVAAPTAAAAGGVVKAVLNGSARRIKETQAALNKHIVSTNNQFEDTKKLMAERHDDLRDRIDNVRDEVGAIDVRVARIEGSRWRRRGDDNG